MAERGYYGLCRTLGRLLRAGRYATARVVVEGDTMRVRKRRRWYAPLVVWLGGPLAAVLDTGVRVLPQRAWAQRERRLYPRLYGASVHVDTDGTLVLPCLPGATLAALLDDPARPAAVRRQAIEHAAAALADFHRRGWTHGDAMVENVMVDLDAGVARWFDFETVHDVRRSRSWRRADDVRALLATCLLRTAPAERAATLRLVVSAYADDHVIRALAPRFASAWQRPLAFHLGQAALAFACFREIARLLHPHAAFLHADPHSCSSPSAASPRPTPTAPGR